MSNVKESEVGAGGSLPLASLSLLVSPLQLTYSYIWQVILQRNVKLYSRVEEFVTLVTESVPALMGYRHYRQTAQLILALRARVILELLREDEPDSQTIQTLINKLKVSASLRENIEFRDIEVELSETSFMVLVQTLLRNPAERTRFFKDVFPVQYGSKFNTGLQALVAGLVCKLEKLLPVPNLTQLGNMIIAESSVLEACGNLLPNEDALKTLLLRHQTPKALVINNPVSANVGDCVLSSLSYRHPAPCNPPPQSPNHSTPEVLPNPNPPPQPTSNSTPEVLPNPNPPPQPTSNSTPEVLPNPNPPPQSPNHSAPEVPPNPNPDLESPEPLEVALNPSSPVSHSDPGDMGAMSDDWDDSEARGDIVEVNTKQKSDTVMVGSSIAETSGVNMSQQIVEVKIGAPPKPELTSIKEQPQQPLKSIPIKVVPVLINATPISQQMNTSAETMDGQQKPQTRRVTLHQWVSQIASNLPLAALPPIPASDMIVGYGAKQSAKKKKKMSVKPPPNRFTCEVCDKNYSHQSQLRDHQRIHSGEKPFPCTACDKSFRTQSFLNNHLKTHISYRPFSCGHCGRCYPHKWSLHRHILTHTSMKPFHCTICNKGFTQSSYFRRHMEVHSSKESHPCQHCGKSFPTLFKLTNHERWHTRERPHMCERCGRRFFAPSLLKRHMGYHAGERQYLCSLCGRTFVYLYDLKNHQRNHDKKKNKLPCPVCQKTFSSKHCLKIHLRIHTNDKPYKCGECGKAFTQVGNLAVHRRKHSSERPYSCEECGNTYKLVSHLKAHCLTHTAEKPWTCATCGKGFTYQGVLKKHERIHTREASGYPRKRRYKSKPKPSLKRKHEDDVDGDDDNDC